MNIELRNKGGKTVIEQHARLLRAHTLKKLGNSGPKQAESEQQSEYELNDEVAEAAEVQDSGQVQLKIPNFDQVKNSQADGDAQVMGKEEGLHEASAGEGAPVRSNHEAGNYDQTGSSGLIAGTNQGGDLVHEQMQGAVDNQEQIGEIQDRRGGQEKYGKRLSL